MKLDIRSIDVSIDRHELHRQPDDLSRAVPDRARRSSAAAATRPTRRAWFESKQSSDYRATECRALKFKPKFFARIFGGKSQTRRAAQPEVPGDPRSPQRRRQPATRRRSSCRGRRSSIRVTSRRSARGSSWRPTNARRTRSTGTPKRPRRCSTSKLKGPVYLTSSDNPLPDLLVNLHGQVTIRLRGVISSEHGRLKTVFNNTPDVAVNKFILNMKGGNKGLLVNSRNLCARPDQRIPQPAGAEQPADEDEQPAAQHPRLPGGQPDSLTARRRGGPPTVPALPLFTIGRRAVRPARAGRSRRTSCRSGSRRRGPLRRPGA